MKEKILKSYEHERQEIDRWFSMAVKDKITRNKKDDAIECIYHSGKAHMLAQILLWGFEENIQEDMENMKKIKDYLKFDFFGRIGGCVAMKDELFKYLESFMIQNNWLDEYTQKQARAIFTTICFVGNIDADTAACDNMLLELYNKADMESIDISYDDFEEFMIELMVNGGNFYDDSISYMEYRML